MLFINGGLHGYRYFDSAFVITGSAPVIFSLFHLSYKNNQNIQEAIQLSIE